MQTFSQSSQQFSTTTTFNGTQNTTDLTGHCIRSKSGSAKCEQVSRSASPTENRQPTLKLLTASAALSNSRIVSQQSVHCQVPRFVSAIGYTEQQWAYTSLESGRKLVY